MEIKEGRSYSIARTESLHYFTVMEQISALSRFSRSCVSAAVKHTENKYIELELRLG